MPLSLTVATLAGAFTLLRPADWSSRVRRAYVFGPGALAAAVTAVAVIRGRARLLADGAEGGDGPGNDDGASGDGGAPAGGDAGTARIRTAVGQAVLAVGAGAAVTGVQVLSLRLDAAMERWLVRHGVTKPRPWMGAAVAIVSLGMDFLDGRASGRATDSR